MEREFISIAEYAEIFNLSKQAVYKKFNKVVQPVVQLESTGCSTDSTESQPSRKRKTLKVSELSEDEQRTVEDWFNQKLNEVVQPVVQPDGKVVQPNSTGTADTTAHLETVIDLLKDQMTQKDAEVERLHGEIDRLHGEIDRQHDQIVTLTRLLDQQQQLQARTVQALPDGKRRSLFDLFRRKPAGQSDDPSRQE